MKKAVLLLVMSLVTASPLRADACVGRILVIGALDAPTDRVLAEMLSVLIKERTGTSVNVRFFRDGKELYAAAAVGQVGVFVDSAERMMDALGNPRERDAKKAYEISKGEFRKRMNLVVLESLGLLTDSGGQGTYYAPVVTLDVVQNFPALPRVLNKLAGKLNDDIHARLMLSARSGDKSGKAARDFLKSKKLI